MKKNLIVITALTLVTMLVGGYLLWTQTNKTAKNVNEIILKQKRIRIIQKLIQI